ncbi:MAG: cyclic nucleotide-binding domain-containing protein [Gammaproteobacteria bacterium]|nr:cyclic nucleotide-binding domain-containing protein [Gammaproteobacteria bacterium]
MSPAGSSEITEALLTRFVPINGIAPKHLKELKNHCEIITIRDEQPIEMGAGRTQYSYYLVEGEIQVLSGSRVTDTIFARTERARFSLSQMREEKQSLRAGSLVKLLRVDRRKISAMLVWSESDDDDGKADTPSIDASILNSEILSRVPPANVQKIRSVVEEVKVKSGDVVIRQGDRGDYYYFIRDGRCLVTRQNEENTAPVEIVELGPGDTFGEEALISNAKRNANVSMITDSVLLRLTKQDFIELIHNPLVNVLDFTKAVKQIKTGGCWLDVRLPEEHENNGLKASINVPLAALRRRIGELNKNTTYIVYCNSGQRSAAAAFLLSQRGFKAYLLEGGLLAATESMATARGGVSKPAADRTDPAELHTELAKVNAELEQAILLKAQAEVARRSVTQSTLIRSNIAQEMLKRSQSHASDASRRASEGFERAKRQKREIESKLVEAEANAAGERKKAEALVQKLREEAEKRLRLEDEQLRLEYNEAAQKIENMRRAKEEAEARFEKERKRVESELAKAQEEIASQASKIQAELRKAQEAAEKRAVQIRENHELEEQRLREEMEERLRAERKRLEAEFAETVSAQEKARYELDRAAAARNLAEEESQRIADELKSAQAKRRAQEDTRVKREKARLEREAKEAKSKLEAAEKAKRALQAARKEYDKTMAVIRKEEKSLDHEKRESKAERALRAELESYQAKMEAAEGQIDEALRAKESADQAKAEAEEKVVTQQAVEEEIRVQLYDEMEQWLKEERDRSEEELSRTQQLTRQQVMLEKRKEAERNRQKAAEATLMSEIGAQLGHDGESGLAQQASAEKRASLTRSAHEEAAAAKAKAKSALEAARAKMKSLFGRGKG